MYGEIKLCTTVIAYNTARATKSIYRSSFRDDFTTALGGIGYWELHAAEKCVTARPLRPAIIPTTIATGRWYSESAYPANIEHVYMSKNALSCKVGKMKTDPGSRSLDHHFFLGTRSTILCNFLQICQKHF